MRITSIAVCGLALTFATAFAAPAAAEAVCVTKNPENAMRLSVGIERTDLPAFELAGWTLTQCPPADKRILGGAGLMCQRFDAWTREHKTLFHSLYGVTTAQVCNGAGKYETALAEAAK